MSKALKSLNLTERPASRTLLAVSLCATMAAFGCTTDRNIGNGDPVVTPGVRTSPTGNTGAGSETGNMPPPMMSSYSGEALPAVQPRRVARVSAAEAAAILAENQPRVRYLGAGYPSAPNRPYVSDGQTNLFTYPAQQVNPRSTVNSSLTSGPTPVVTSGAGEGIGGGVDAATAEFLDASGAILDTGTAVTGVSGASTLGSTAMNLGANVTSADTAASVTPSAATVSPTAAATVVPSGFAATRSLSPTAAAVVNPPASVSGLATQSATTVTGTSTIAGRSVSPTAASVANAPASVSALPATATRTATTARRTTAPAMNSANGTATAATAANASTNVGVSSPVRVVTDANGRMVVTNQRQR